MEEAEGEDGVRKPGLTALGRQMAAFPLDPKLSRALIAGCHLGAGEELLWIVAGLSHGNLFVTSTASVTHPPYTLSRLSRGE